jgi:hypothetical protein
LRRRSRPNTERVYMRACVQNVVMKDLAAFKKVFHKMEVAFSVAR